MMGIRRTRNELLDHMVLLRATAPMPGWSPHFVFSQGGDTADYTPTNGFINGIGVPFMKYHAPLAHYS